MGDRDLKPTGDRILVKLRKDLQKVGRVWLPSGGQSLDVLCSEVVALGPDVKAKPWHLAVGDYVLHVRVVGVAYDGVLGQLGIDSQNNKSADYKLLRESELLATVNPDSVGHVTGHASYSDGKVGARATSDL